MPVKTKKRASRKKPPLLLSRKLLQRRPASVAAATGIVIGIAVVITILAAASYAVVDVTSGVLSGPAQVVSNTLAQGGKAVEFGSSSSSSSAPAASATPSPTSSTPTPKSTAPTTTPTTAPTEEPKPDGVSGNWTLTFDDEFNGSSIDTTKWNVEGPTAPNNSQEYDCYSPVAASESGGYLNLALLNQKCTVSGTSYQYTGAQIDTDNKFSQTYGYFEARVYSPGSGSTVANWGAFWLTNENWPTDGEIDTFEGYHGSAGYHFEYAPSGTAIWQGGQASGNYTGWHVYGVDWQPGSITFYYDGKEMGSYTTGASDLHYPMFIICDYTTGPEDNVGGPVLVPATEQFDYVRAWSGS